MERESFVFYSSFLKAIRAIKKRDIQAELALAIIEYGITGETTECGEVVSVAMELIKPQIEANNKKYINGMKGAEHGLKGGRPRKEKPQENPEVTPEKPQPNPNQTPNVNDNVNDDVNDDDDKDASAITDEKKYYSSDNGVIKSISELKCDYLNDENLCNAIIKNLKVIDKNMISEQLEAFNQHLELQGERLKEVRDYRSHFKNWLKKRQEVAKNTPVTTAPKRIRFDENGNEITY
jgi:hypothetical protein bacD2_23229